MKENAFKPDRSDGCDGVRHIPVPAQGSTLIFSGDTPTDAEAPPVLATYNNDMQSLLWSENAPPNIGATHDLMQQGLGLDFLGTIPRVTDFPSGPGDDTPGDPGWM